jgi:hypothetical protein
MRKCIQTLIKKIIENYNRSNYKEKKSIKKWEESLLEYASNQTSTAEYAL